MQVIKVLPNVSIKEALILSLHHIEPKEYSSIQLMNLNPFRIKSPSGTIYEIMSNKIVIGVKKGKWFVSEFKLIPSGELAPRQFKGDYELLDEFDAQIYGE